MNRDRSIWLWIILGAVLLAGGGAAGVAVYNSTRGLRNNNPGNIRATAGTTWQGQTGVDSAGFCIFDTPADGVRALSRILTNYGSQDGLDTVTDIINRWAPPSENNTSAYIADVCNQTGFAAYDPLDMTDPGTITALTNAIIAHENGQNPYTAAIITQGVQEGMA